MSDLHDRLAALAEKATRGEWEIVGATHIWSPSAKANVASCSALRDRPDVGYSPPAFDQNLAEVARNSALIVALRNALPEILAAFKSRDETRREAFREAAKVCETRARYLRESDALSVEAHVTQCAVDIHALAQKEAT